MTLPRGEVAYVNGWQGSWNRQLLLHGASLRERVTHKGERCLGKRNVLRRKEEAPGLNGDVYRRSFGGRTRLEGGEAAPVPWRRRAKFGSAGPELHRLSPAYETGVETVSPLHYGPGVCSRAVAPEALGSSCTGK